MPGSGAINNWTIAGTGGIELVCSPFAGYAISNFDQVLGIYQGAQRTVTSDNISLSGTYEIRFSCCGQGNNASCLGAFIHIIIGSDSPLLISQIDAPYWAVSGNTAVNHASAQYVSNQFTVTGTQNCKLQVSNNTAINTGIVFFDNFQLYRIS